MKNYIKKSLKTSNGITLIALVITIIVLLILAGISISMLSGDNSILQKATTAKENTERAEIVENAKMDVLSEITDNKGSALKESQLKSVLEKYFVNSEIPEKLPSDLSTLELTTLNNKYNIKVSEIYDGNLTRSSSSEGTVTLASDVLIVNLSNDLEDYQKSPYVLYKDKNNNDILCRVLYNNSGTVEIVTIDAIDTVTLGSSDPTIPASADGYDFTKTGDALKFEKARWSYNNAITSLNAKAETYRNTALSDRARCVGSNPTTPSSQSGAFTFPSGYTTPLGYSEMPYFLDTDDNYTTDYTRLQAIGANGLRTSGNYFSGISTSFYWLASRDLWSDPDMTEFGVRRVRSSGSEDYATLCDYDGGVNANYNPSYGFRSVFRLASGVTIESGDGTVDFPYVLVAP